jgi:ABC-type lipoprotein release transport system permease subunit
VLVATLNIVSGLIMLVKDKTDDIAIMRTMGASRGTVLRVFLITGAAIGVVRHAGRLHSRRRLRQEHREHPPRG